MEIHDQEKYAEGLSRTRTTLWGRIKGLFASAPTLDPAHLEELEEILLAADVGVAAAERFLADLRSEVGRGLAPTRETVSSFLRAWIVASLGAGQSHAPDAGTPPGRPRVVLIVGVNGTGKTTTAGKLANRLGREGKKVMLVAADTFRAAAAEQLQIWSQRSGAAFVRGAEGSDPAAVVHDALGAAQAGGFDVVLIDTAGRLHTKEPLMDELGKIRRVAGRIVMGSPHEVLLVLDGTTGQNGLHQARIFTRAAGVTALVVTKMDGTAKGGFLVPVVGELGHPVRWIGLGEGVDDLLPFDARSYARGLVGEG